MVCCFTLVRRLLNKTYLITFSTYMYMYLSIKYQSRFINTLGSYENKTILDGVRTKPHRTKPHTDKTPQDKTPLDKTPLTTGQNPTSFIMYEWIQQFFIAILH